MTRQDVCCNDAENADFLDELDDTELLERLRNKRLTELASRIDENDEDGEGPLYGEITQLTREKELLDLSISVPRLVVHFSRNDFRRCQIMSDHLKRLAKKYPRTKFVIIEAEKAPFMVVKLQIQVLPCVVCIMNSVACDRIVGFDELGGTDNFDTAAVEKRLLLAGIIGKSGGQFKLRKGQRQHDDHRDRSDSD